MPPPDHHDFLSSVLMQEVWVPASDLDTVLKLYPRAVPLTHDQLVTLLEDARADLPSAQDPDSVPPERAVLRQARFTGWLVSGPREHPQVRVEADLEVEALSDAWADVSLGLPGVTLGTAEMEGPGQAVLVPAPMPSLAISGLVRNISSQPAVRLLVQGRGVHHVRLSYLLPVRVGPDGNSIPLPDVDGVGELTLHLPAGTRASSNLGCAVKAEDAGTVATVALGHLDRNAVRVKDQLTWRTPPPAPAEAATVLQDSWVQATVEQDRVSVQQVVNLRPVLGRLPAEASISLPAEARAVRVERAAGKWDLDAQGLRVALVPAGADAGERDAPAEFSVLYELPLPLDAQGATGKVSVPLLEVSGAHRVTGRCAVMHGNGLQVRRLDPGPVAKAAAPGAIPRPIETSPNFVAGFALSDLPQAKSGPATPPALVEIEARRSTARFSVDADARADFELSGLTIARTLTFHIEEGEVFNARIRLPHGETVLNLHPSGENAANLDWRQDGDDLILAWNAGLPEQSSTVLALDTRADFVAPKAGAPADFSFAGVAVPGAERLTGYIALAHDPALRLIPTGGEDALERRDGRTTPVLGEVAWFYRDDFHLALRIERRAAEMEARFTGYALPLAGAVEMHGQIAFQFLYSGVEEVKVRVPAESADAFFFSGDHIAERRRDGDVWTIRFQGEQSGAYALGVQATIPAPADPADPARFHFRLPAIVPLDTARWSGEWAVEANVDTEIRFTASGANEVDALNAPALPGYQPKRRVIGVFEFLGGASGVAVDLDGVRHPAAGGAPAAVDRLEIEAFASTSGVVRHRATLLARTAADGFFNIHLPPGAALWSLTRDGLAIKPVGDSAGELRVELPGGRAPGNASRIVIVYETPGPAWGNGGSRAIAAPQFDPGVPVLQSQWKLHVPDGFDYRVAGPGGEWIPLAAPSAHDLLIPRLGRAFERLRKGAAVGVSNVLTTPADRRSPAPAILNDARIPESIAMAPKRPASTFAAGKFGGDADDGGILRDAAKETEQREESDQTFQFSVNGRMGKRVFMGGGVAGVGGEARVAGLLPIRLDLPANGRLYEITGGGEPGAIKFHYADWRAEAQGRWIGMTLGALGFLALASWAGPWRKTLYAALALTFFPLIIAPSWTETCNALLAGWLWAVAGWSVARFLLRQRPAAAAALLLGAACLAPGHARAEEPAKVWSPETVIVPYDASKHAGEQAPTEYYLPYERFLTLWDAAKHHRRPPAPELPAGDPHFSIGAARYEAQLEGDDLEIEATLNLVTFGDGWVSVPVKFEGAQISGVTLDGAPAAQGEDGLLWIGAPGAHQVRASLRLPAAKLAAGSTLTWGVPQSAAALVTLLLPPESNLRAEITGSIPGIGEVEENTPSGRRLTASAGGTSSITVTFHDAPPPAPAAGQPALARVMARLIAGLGPETLQAEINLSLSGGAQDHFTVLLDPSLTLTGLDAPDIKQWRLSTSGGRQALDITLSSPARDGYHLSLSADRHAQGPIDAPRTFPLVSAAAGRLEETSVLLTETGVEMTLPDGPPSGARRVEDPASDPARLFGAFAGDGTSALVYSVHALAEKRAAHIDYLYQIGQGGKIDLAASVRLVPGTGGAPLDTADLRLPQGYLVEAVAGPSVRQWWRAGDVLSLRFAPDAQAQFIVYLVRRFEHAPARLQLQPLTPADFGDVDGQTVVAADRSLKAGLILPEGVRARNLSEIEPATAAPEFQVKPPLERQRAFRYEGANFDVAATLETEPARWQAQWVSDVTVRDGLLALETHVNVEGRQGAVDGIEFTLPIGLPEARVSGPDVRETVAIPGGDPARRTYRVLWQNPVYSGGEAAFVINLDVPLGAGGQQLPDLAFPGSVGGAGGFLLVENASSGEMTLDHGGLDPALEKDVPFLPPSIVAGTRFFRAAPGQPWRLGVQVTDLEKTAGRAALVAYAELTSTLRADGEEWHRAVYRLQNRRLQFLPVELPSGMEFIGARVAGESVRVDAGPGAQLLVPLLKTRPGEQSYEVELTYRRPARGNGRTAAFGRWTLDDPRLPGVPIEKTLWDVWLPADASLLSAGGNVQPVVAALTETEKLESELADLRDLSATYASDSASETVRTRAIKNYNDLAAKVAEGTKQKAEYSGQIQTDASAFFKKLDVSGQSAMVSQKQQSIRGTLDSLNAANGLVADQFGVRRPRHEAGSAGGGAPLGMMNGQALQAELAPQWKDNRLAFQNRLIGAQGGGSAVAGKPEAAKEQLALNDSLSVELPESSVSGASSYAIDKSAARLMPQSFGNLSAARARQDAPAALEAQVATATVAAAAVPAMPMAAPAMNEPASASNAPVLGDVPVMGDLARGEPANARPETLRAAGRISLAVEIPRDGQVYHFEKLQSGARLTLWSVRPARLARLGWLGVLVVALAAAWLTRRALRWLAPRLRRRSAPAVVVAA